MGFNKPWGGITGILPYLNKKCIAVFFSWFGIFWGNAFISVQSAFRQGKQEKSHSAAVHSSGRIHLTTQRAHFEGDILCVVWQAAQATKIYCVCVYSRRFGWWTCSYWQRLRMLEIWSCDSYIWAVIYTKLLRYNYLHDYEERSNSLIFYLIIKFYTY